MEKTSYEAGAPSWIDLGSPDAEAAAGFYSQLFGWEVQDLGEEAGGYRMASLHGRLVAGLGSQMNPDGPPYWTTYFSVVDAEATTARVLAEGGQVLAGPMDVFDAGRMAVYSDPAGAPFSVWQPGSHIGAQLAYERGTMCWHELSTPDSAAAATFYGRVFGWEMEEEDIGGRPYRIWKLGTAAIGGVLTQTGEEAGGAPPSWMVYFAVGDCDATVAKVKELGGSVLAEPEDIAPGRFAVVSDAHGAVFAVINEKPAEGEATGSEA